jgi:hypothetical protein
MLGYVTAGEVGRVRHHSLGHFVTTADCLCYEKHASGIRPSGWNKLQPIPDPFGVQI